MATAKPFSWVVRFTVAPTWIQDGFTLSDERALAMLALEVGGAYGNELSAQILEAPSPLQIARMQGYTKEDKRAADVVRGLKKEAPDAGQIYAALIAARRLIDSVAFVAQPGDSEPVVAAIDAALALIDPRQGDAFPIEA